MKKFIQLFLAVAVTTSVGCSSDDSLPNVGDSNNPTPSPTPAPPSKGATPASDAGSSVPTGIADAGADVSNKVDAGALPIDCSTLSLSVTYAYKIALLRSPDAGGLAYWLDRLQGNPPFTRLAMLQQFVALPEFTTVHAGFTDEQFMTGLYTQFLGRTASTSEVQYWVGRLTAGEVTRSGVARFFVDSPEFANPTLNPAYACFF